MLVLVYGEHIDAILMHSYGNILIEHFVGAIVCVVDMPNTNATCSVCYHYN